MSTRMLKFKLSKIGKQMETKKTHEMQDLDFQGVMMNPPIDGAINVVLDEQNLTEPQRRHFEEKKAQIEAIKTATETEEMLKKIALANLTYAMDLQGKCNRIKEKHKREIEKINESNNANAKKYDAMGLKLSKAMGAMLSAYRAIDRHFGDEIRANLKKNFETQDAGLIKMHLAEIERLTKGANKNV